MNDLFASVFGIQPSQIGTVLPSVFGSFSLEFILKSVGLYVLIVWIAFVVWVVRDISNRTSSILLQTFAILVVVVFTPIFWLPIYLLIRPKATLFEQYYEELEMAEAEYEESHRCSACGGIVEAEYRFCPHCAEELLEACVSCGKLVQKGWAHCPYCGKEPRKEIAVVKTEKQKKKAAEWKAAEKPSTKTETDKAAPEKKKEEAPIMETPPKKERTHNIVAEEI